MLPYILGVIYFAACIGCGYLGRNAVIGSIGTALLAFVLSPLVVFLALILFARRVRTKRASV